MQFPNMQALWRQPPPKWAAYTNMPAPYSSTPAGGKSPQDAYTLRITCTATILHNIGCRKPGGWSFLQCLYSNKLRTTPPAHLTQCSSAKKIVQPHNGCAAYAYKTADVCKLLQHTMPSMRAPPTVHVSSTTIDFQHSVHTRAHHGPEST